MDRSEYQSRPISRVTDVKRKRNIFQRMLQGNRRYKIGALIIALLLIIAVATTIFWFLHRQSTQKPLTNRIAQAYQKQLPELKQVVNDKPNDATAHKNYGVALYATDDLDGAKKQYEAATELNDKDATAFNNLGNVYRDLGETSQAIEAYKKALALNPKSVNTYANLANIQLYAQNKPQDAIATYKQGLEALPANSQLELLLAIAYEQAKDIDSAKKTYEHILTYDKDNTAAQASLDRLNK